MRPFRLKKTITHATVLSALLPSVAALSQQMPVGLSGQITISAGATAILGHELVPVGVSPLDPATAPSRGGYVYDSFNTVVRTGVTRECVKHGLWTPEIATPDCEPWLFAVPPAPQPKAAAAPAPAPTPAPTPVPAPKEEGFPEWTGPDEARLGIVPLWDEEGIEPEDTIGLPRMEFGDDQEETASFEDGIGDPIHYGDVEDEGIDGQDLVSPPVVYYHDGDESAVGDDLIGAPRAYDDSEGVALPSDEQWPADPYAALDEEPATASNDNWVPPPPEEKTEEPASGIMAFKDENEKDWPADSYAAEDQEPATASNDGWMPSPAEEKAEEPATGITAFNDDQGWPTDNFASGEGEQPPVVESDSSWVIPNPLPESLPDEMIGRYQEDAKEPEEAIGDSIVYHDSEDQGVIPEETIIGHTLVPDKDQEDEGKAPEDTIIGHSVYHDDTGSGAAPADDDISFPRHYAQEDTPTEQPAEQIAAAPYKSPFDDQPYPEAADEDDEEGEPYTSYYDQGTPAPAITEQPVAIAAAPTPSEPPYAAGAPDEADKEEVEEPYVSDYSKVPTAKVESPPVAKSPAPTPPPAPAAAPEEHIMTVVLSADALFDFDRYVLRQGGKKSLDDLVAALKDIKWGEILVVGHTDRLGSAKYNQRLSERRAQAVRKQLIGRGLDGKKIKAVGKGKNQPVTSDCVGNKRSKDLIACLQPDRRVEIFVDEKREVKVIKPAAPKK